MDIKDLAGLSQPLTKLIEVIAQGVGGVSRPFLTRKNANADAYRIEKITTALSEAAEKSGTTIEYKDGAVEVLQLPASDLLSGDNKTLEQRTEERVAYQEQKRTENLEKITSGAAQDLIDVELISDKPLDEDWITRFFASAKDVSSEEMQELWSRLLAGEVKEPGSYSVRTLQFLRNMSKEEAELIAKIGQYVVRGGSELMILGHCEKWIEENVSFTQQNFIRLTEIGIVSPTQLQYQVSQSKTIISHGTMGVLITAPEGKNIPAVTVWKFTPLANELLTLVSQNDDEQYLKAIAKGYKKHSMTTHKMIDVQYKSGGEIAARQIGEI